MRKILFIVATHGDEGFSVPLLKKLERQYPKVRYGYDWLVANPRALKQGVRYTDTDLNRSAPGNAKSSYYEERRAAELIALTAGYDCVIDIHGSAGQCGLITIITYPTEANVQLAGAIPVSKHVVWYAETSAVAGPLTQHAFCPAIEIECGPKTDPAVSRQLYGILETIVNANAQGSFYTGTIDIALHEVYGLENGQHDPSVIDFKETSRGGETFLPLMSNQYEGITCYKMRAIPFAGTTGAFSERPA